MPQQQAAQVVQVLPMRSADLSEALDAVELLGEVLTQSIARRGPTRLQRAALTVVEGLRSKHNRARADRRRRRNG